jgi:hypothetical protein
MTGDMQKYPYSSIDSAMGSLKGVAMVAAFGNCFIS